MTRISITVYRHPGHEEQDFATISTLVVEQDFFITADIPADIGEEKLEEMAKKFNETIRMSPHKAFSTWSVSVSY